MCVSVWVCERVCAEQNKHPIWMRFDSSLCVMPAYTVSDLLNDKNLDNGVGCRKDMTMHTWLLLSKLCIHKTMREIPTISSDSSPQSHFILNLFFSFLFYRNFFMESISFVVRGLIVHVVFPLKEAHNQLQFQKQIFMNNWKSLKSPLRKRVF